MFKANVNNYVNQRTSAHQRRSLKPNTAARFSSVFCTIGNDKPALVLALDCVTLYITVPNHTKLDPWLNDIAREARRMCERAEHKCKADQIHMSYEGQLIHIRRCGQL